MSILTKRHHYIPQFYLKNFTDQKNLVWVFDRKKKEYRKQSPKDTTVQSNYYTFKDKGGKKNTEIEKFFSSIEGQTKPILEKVNRRKLINEEEKYILATFISFQKTRVPDFEKLMNESSEKMIKAMNKRRFYSVEATKEIFRDYEKTTGKKINGTAKEMYDFIQQDRYYVKFPRERSIRDMLYLGQAFIDYYIQMDWLILWAPEHSTFITSDNPFILMPPSNYDPNNFWSRGVGIITPGAKKVFPLTAKACLVMGDHGDRVVDTEAPATMVTGINAYSAINSDRFLISGNKRTLKELIRLTKVDKKHKGERISMG